MLVDVAIVLADKNTKIVPVILVTGSGGPVDGLAATLTKLFAGKAGEIAKK